MCAPDRKRWLRQVAIVPSGATYFRLYSYQQLMRVVCVLQHLERKSFAIGLGCELTHAHKLVYTAGVDLADAETSVAIGAGCKVCDRPACAQRAFPFIGRPVHGDPHASTALPYPSTTPH
jgi:XRE family transcriptional regulator, fatty acid utilization regulator